MIKDEFGLKRKKIEGRDINNQQSWTSNEHIEGMKDQDDRLKITNPIRDEQQNQIELNDDEIYQVGVNGNVQSEPRARTPLQSNMDQISGFTEINNADSVHRAINISD